MYYQVRELMKHAEVEVKALKRTFETKGMGTVPE
jgi:hypothetical protein